MANRIAALGTTLALLVLFTALTGAQEMPARKQTPNVDRGQLIDASKLGEPAFSDTENSIAVEVWLLSRQEYSAVTSGAKPGRSARSGDGGDPAEVAVAIIRDEETRQPITSASVELIADQETRSASKARMIDAEGHYMKNLDLAPDKEYTFTLKVNHNGQTSSFEFEKGNEMSSKY